MPAEDVMAEQDRFLRDGGVFLAALRSKRKSGELAATYEHQDYPKALYVDRGKEKVKRSAETVDRKTISWEEEVPLRDTIIVHSEEEEERVRSGGATDAQDEEERKALMARARSFGMKPGRDWSLTRLRRELGEALNAPEPVNEMATARKRLAELEELAAMKLKIAELEAQLGAPADDVADLRAQLTALGVRHDGRWSSARLRQALDEATAPAAA